MIKYETRTILTKNLDFMKGKVLDLGCGRSKYKGLILSRAESYTGVDKYKYGDNVDIITDAENTPFSDNNFDTILCLAVIEHVKEPHKVIKECSRILKPGGHIILTTAWVYPYHGEPEDFFRFSRKALEFLFSHDFKIIKLDSNGGKFRIFSVLARRWIKNQKVSQIATLILEKLDSLLNKSKFNLDTPSHFLVAQKNNTI